LARAYATQSKGEREFLQPLLWVTAVYFLTLYNSAIVVDFGVKMVYTDTVYKQTTKQ